MGFAFNSTTRARIARWLIMTAESPVNALYHLADRLKLDDDFARLVENRSRNSRFKKYPFWLMEGAVELLELVHERMPLSIVSARDEITTMRFVESFQLGRYFHKIVTSQTCEHTKPYADPVLWAASQMKVAPENCVMIGDTTVDILAGRAAGAQTIGVLCGFGSKKELQRAGADLIVNGLRELFPIFKTTAS
jgi:HAD superfamily hydrolase (TIGR01549 family)